MCSLVTQKQHMNRYSGTEILSGYDLVIEIGQQSINQKAIKESFISRKNTDQPKVIQL